MTNTNPTDTTVFGSAPTDKTPTAGETTQQSILADLVGEGKKFKSVEDLAKGKVESDKFIEKLTEELAEMRKELSGLASVNQTVEELKRLRNHSDAGTPTPAVDPDQLISEMEKRLDARTEQRNKEQNLIEADRMIVEIFKGDREASTKFLRDKAKELGVGVEWLTDLASNSPKAALNLLGLNVPAAPTAGDKTKVTSSVNTSATLPSGAGPKEGTKEYFDEIRKRDKNEYFSAKVQNAIFEARKKGTYVI